MKCALKMIVILFIAQAVLAVGIQAAIAYSGEDFIVCRLNPQGDNYLSLRTCGSSKCDEIMRLGPGSWLLSSEPFAENGWRHVIVRASEHDENYSGPSGWVFARYICQVIR